MVKIIITVAIFLTLNISANQKLKKDCENGKMLSCVELGIFSKGCDISEHDAYCFKYYELRDKGYDYVK